MSGKKSNHHTVWLEDELHLYLIGLELKERERTGEEAHASTIIRRIIRQAMEAEKLLNSQDSQGGKK